MVTDQAEPGEANEDELELEPISPEEVRNLLPIPPTVRAALERQDQQRATALFWIAGPMMAPAMPALESLLLDAERMVTLAEELGETPQLELAQRVYNDVLDAIDGMLLARDARVLESCRDLMELTVLFRDFEKQPARFVKWQKVPEGERMRAFGFEKLLRKYPDEPVPYLGPDLDALSIEYTLHSRTLHPAMYLGPRQNLSRSIPEDQLDAVLFYSGMVTEIVRHGTAAVAVLLVFLLTTQDGSDPDREYDIEFDYWEDDNAGDAWMAWWREVQPVPPPEFEEEMRAVNEQLRRRRPREHPIAPSEE